MLGSFSSILCLLVAAETITQLADLPIPGAAIGLAIVALRFHFTRQIDPDYERIFDSMAPHVPLLFVPAAVGVVAHFEALASFWIYFAAAIIGGTAMALVVTGLCATATLRIIGQETAS